MFFDEIDALMMTRGGDGESDATRRLKVEMLQQMDGINSGDGVGVVMVLATTNKPWDLDEALRRRLEKRIYIELPDLETRAEAFQIHLKSVPLEVGDRSSTEDDAPRIKLMGELSKQTEGYTGSDIRLICREAAMMPMRRLMASMTPVEIAGLKKRGELEEALGLRLSDFQESIRKTQSSVDVETLKRYEAWTNEFASQ